MLGTDLVAAGAARGFDVHSYDLPEFNITDTEHVRNVVEASDAVINCAAYTDVDGAETHVELAHRVNAHAVGCLGELAARQGKWVLHFSTDFIFDGTLERPYQEADSPNPINEYGRSKWREKNCLPAAAAPIAWSGWSGPMARTAATS
jgi:dTDP-4-dehydrorhamnose reductase